MALLGLKMPGTSGRLVLAIVLSMVAHLLALFGHHIDLTREPDVVRLDAFLMRTAPDQKPGAAPVPDKPPQPAVPKPVPEETPLPAKAEAKDPPADIPPPPPQLEPEVKSPATPQPEVPDVPPAPAQAGANAWPRSGVIRYQLFGGESRDPSGSSNAALTWEIAADGRYTMKLESTDAKPFPSMPWFTISFSYSSRGQMVGNLFQPERYEEAISVFQNIAVNFDWEKKQVDFAGHQLPLEPGTLDYLTVLMQAGDPGFIERGVMSVATGRGLRQYRFDSLGDGDLALPFGMTKTRQLHGKTANNDVRVWIATERFNLPVQIKFVVNRVNYYLVATEVMVARDAVAATPTPALPVVSTANTEKNNALDTTTR